MKKPSKTPSLHRAAILSLATLSFSLPLWAQNTATLPDGTRIRLEVLDELSSNKSKVGQDVRMRVHENVMGSQQEVLIRRGAPAMARITRAKGSRSLGRAGKLEFTIESVEAVDGSKVPLRSQQEASGKQRTGPIAAAAVLVTPFTLFIKGRNATIKPGTVFDTYVDQTVPIQAEAATDNTTGDLVKPVSRLTIIDEPDTTVVAPSNVAPIADAQPVLVTLTDGKTVEGVLTGMQNNQVMLSTDIGELRIDAAKITSIVAQDEQGTPQPVLVRLRNGKQVEGTLESYSNGSYTLQTSIGTVNVKRENVLSLSLATPVTTEAPSE